MNIVWNQDFNPYKHLETWRNPEDLAKDKEYDEKANTTPEDTKEVQEKAKEGLFWEFKNPENGNEKESLKKTENNEKKEIKLESDSPYFPILEELKEKWLIDNNKFSDIIQKINNSSLEDGKTEFLKLVNSLTNKDIKNSILDSFNSKEEITEKNFKDTEFLKNSWDLINLDNWVWGLEISLAKNYVNFTDKNWNSDKKRNLNICLNTTLNSIISKNSTDFRQENWELIWDIKKESNLDIKYSLLKKLYKNDLIDDAKHWWKKSKEEISLKQNSLKNKAKELVKQKKEAESIKNREERNQKLKEIEAQIQQIIDEGNFLDSFEKEIQNIVSEVDSLSWWENDKINETSEKEEK